MSNAAQYLIDADTIRISAIYYNLDAPAPLVSGPKTAWPPCIDKPAGTLDLTLSTKTDFNFQMVPDVKLALEGRIAGADPSGDTLVEWTVDQDIGTSFTKYGLDVDLEHVRGTIRAACRALIPRVEDYACDGKPRSRAAILDTLPGNEIVMGVKIAGLPFDISASSVMFTASALDQFSFGLGIEPVLDECGIGAGAGATQSFWAKIEDAGGLPIDYAWNVSGGGQAAGPTDDYVFAVALDGQPATVSVKVTVAGVARTASLNWHAETDESRRIKTIRCRMFRFVTRNFPIDPLWDPIRARRPMFRADIARARKVLDDFAELIAEAEMALAEAPHDLG